jgi:hypothetical protein
MFLILRYGYMIAEVVECFVATFLVPSWQGYEVELEKGSAQSGRASLIGHACNLLQFPKVLPMGRKRTKSKLTSATKQIQQDRT